MIVTKVKHPETGQTVDVVKMVLSDNNGLGSELYAINKGSREVYRKAANVDVTNVIGYETFTHAAQYYEPFSITLVPLAGYQALPWNTVVTMGGTDITATAYNKSTNAISIAKVTGDISITAEAVEMSSDYVPLRYIYKYTHGNYFDLGYAATNKTGIYMDILITNQALSMMINRVNSTPTGADVTPDFFWMSMSASANLYGRVRWGNLTRSGTSYVRTPPISKRFTASLNKGVFSYKNDTTDWSLSLTSGTFNDGVTVPYNIRLFGYTSTTYGGFRGYIFRVWHTENDIIEDDYIPVKVLSNGYLGLYNVKKGTLLGSYSPNYYQAPAISISSSYTNCVATRVSAVDTGSNTRAVIGSTWSIKLTPSSGYTFERANAPTVAFDGVDVSSDTSKVTIVDNGDDTYTLTILNVPDCPIAINAKCIDKFTIQGLQTLTPTVTVGTSYIGKLVHATGYQMLPWNVVVTDNGVDITATAYDMETGFVTIESVAGEVSIVAEAVELDSSLYEPIEWVENVSAVNGKGSFTTPYKPCDTTKIEMVCAILEERDYSCVFGTSGISMSPRYFVQAKYINTANTGWGFGNYTSAGSGANIMRRNSTIKQTIIANAKQLTYTTKNENRYTITSSTTLETPWRSTRNLQLCSSVENTSTTYYSRTRLWRCKISEDSTLLYDYIPVKKVSDNSVGVWDKVNGTFIQGDYTFIAPYRGIGGTRTNCAITRLSDATTGTTVAAVIGSTWSIKITPSSGYTFTGGTTPQVEIDGVDVTSTTVTDNGDGTYTLTIVDVPDKPISISAACVADPNAVQSNSLLTGTPTNTPDEPMGDNGDEEEM